MLVLSNAPQQRQVVSTAFQWYAQWKIEAISFALIIIGEEIHPVMSSIAKMLISIWTDWTTYANVSTVDKSHDKCS